MYVFLCKYTHLYIVIYKSYMNLGASKTNQLKMVDTSLPVVDLKDRYRAHPFWR